MTSDVVLTAAMRTNLLSLQNTQNVIDVTQNRLATGRKVNSALDNPQSFFASQALNIRASDLTRLLDGIGQSIQVSKAADNGITAMSKMIESADAIAKQAQDALAQGTAEAKVVGNKDLRGINDLTTISGIAVNDELVLSITDEDGNALAVAPYGQAAVLPAQASFAVAITAGMSVDQFDDSGRAVTQGAQVEIGGNERYVSVSRAEFKRVFRGEAEIPLKQPELPLKP